MLTKVETPPYTLMHYDITFTADGAEAFEGLEPTEQVQIRSKLNQIASCEFRSPQEWDFCRLEGRADGRFCIGKGLRVFADIDDANGVIRIRYAGRREDLYT